jgi:hypothetical protein
MRVLAAVVSSFLLTLLVAAPDARGQAVLLAGTTGDGQDGLLGSVSVADAAWTTIGDPTPDGDLQGLAINAVGDLYGISNSGLEEGHILLRIDRDTGALLETVGELFDTEDGSSLQMSDISFRPGTGVLYGLCQFPVFQLGTLWVIDVATGACTIVETTGLEPGGMAFAPDGTLWVATNSATPELAQINPDTAAVVGSKVALPVPVDALAVRSDGTLFGKEFPTLALFTIEPSDGSTTAIGNIDAPADGVGALVFMEPSFTEVGPHFLPRTVRVKLNATKPEKSTLIATGFLDLGPDPVDLAQEATLEVGDYSVTASLEPNKKATSFTLKQAGLLFKLTPDRSGSSRALFTLRVKDDLEGLVDPESELVLHFVNAAVDAIGVVTLQDGRYTLGRKRGALIEPALHAFKVRGTLKGPGLDAINLRVGLATQGFTPAGAPAVQLDFGPDFEATVPSSAFVKKGDQFVFKGDIGGLTSIVLDYLRETVTVKGKGLDLGEYVEGPQPVSVMLGVGLETREVSVRMVRKKKSLKY